MCLNAAANLRHGHVFWIKFYIRKFVRSFYNFAYFQII